jgi:cell division protein FtsB
VLRFVVVAIATLLFVDALVGDKGLVEIVKARQDYQDLETSLTHIRTENARMRVQARLLREDADTIEHEARERLGFIRPGEKLFILKDVAPAQPK